jgi:hypothetical protein
MERYFGPDERPILIFGCVIKMRGVWNERGYLEVASYFDEQDAPVRAEDGCAQMRASWVAHSVS